MTSILHPCSYLENHLSTMWKEKLSETRTIVQSITWGLKGLAEETPPVQALGFLHLWKICPVPFFKVHLPDGDIIEGTLCQKKKKVLKMCIGEMAGSRLKRKASQDRHVANELEAPKPKGGDGKKCSPIWDRERNPAHTMAKNT